LGISCAESDVPRKNRANSTKYFMVSPRSRLHVLQVLAGSKSPTRQPPAPKRFGGGASQRYGDGA
jgi:hypothetical protein